MTSCSGWCPGSALIALASAASAESLRGVLGPCIPLFVSVHLGAFVGLEATLRLLCRLLRRVGWSSTQTGRAPGICVVRMVPALRLVLVWR